MPITEYLTCCDCAYEIDTAVDVYVVDPTNGDAAYCESCAHPVEDDE